MRASVREGGRGFKVGGEGAKRKLFTSHFDNVKSYLFSLRKLIKNLPVNLQVKFTCKIYLYFLLVKFTCKFQDLPVEISEIKRSAGTFLVGS